ncbi:hypothetical protein AB3S75_031407 [Citrus x aurantiifolia]
MYALDMNGTNTIELTTTVKTLLQKTVQGYKFNIFYPDLSLKTKAPTYSFEEDTESTGGQTCIIRFHAGPPCEDIAFRIVNREWEYSSKQGFKCTFERGMLQLHFNFKRLRYRR